jgi:RNA polymerase sigma-54 factor
MSTQRLSQSQGQSQSQIPLQKIIQFSKLVQAPNHELAQTVKQELKENLFLSEEMLMDDPRMVSLDADSPTFEHDADIMQLLTQRNDDIGHKMEGDGGTFSDIPDDRRSHFASRESREDDLIKQLTTIDLTEREREISLVLIYSIDANGLLPDQAELEKNSKLNPEDKAIAGQLSRESIIEMLERDSSQFTSAEVLTTIDKLQRSLSPAGLLASSPQESLILQLSRMDDSYDRNTAMYMVKDHYQDFLARNYSQLVRSMSVDADSINYAYKTLEHLSPFPYKVESQNLPLVKNNEPDFVVSVKRDGSYQVKLINDTTPKLNISENEREMFAINRLKYDAIAMRPEDKQSASDKQFKQYYEALKEQFKEITEMQKMLVKRKQLLESVLTHVVNKQRDVILSNNLEKALPELMVQTARQFGLSATTISNLANQKVLVTEDGKRFNVSDLFSKGAKMSNGQRISNGEVFDKIREWVKQENPRKPLTDIELEAKFREHGIGLTHLQIGRRREQVGIPDSRSREIAYNKQAQSRTV